jgi:hypothetical protein
MSRSNSLSACTRNYIYLFIDRRVFIYIIITIIIVSDPKAAARLMHQPFDGLQGYGGEERDAFWPHYRPYLHSISSSPS